MKAMCVWMSVMLCVSFSALPQIVCASSADVEKAVDQANAVLWKKFIGADGLIHDYVGEIPTPEDCVQGRPNAIGWWSPIENGPMFTGSYLAVFCERVRREGRPEDREKIRRLVKGLLLCASVSDVKGDEESVL